MKKFLDDLKKTFRFYKSLRNKPKSKKETSDVTVRPDAIAFLTCPRPVLESEKMQKQ